MKDIADQIGELSWKIGESGKVGRNVLRYIYENNFPHRENFHHIASWLYYGGENAFLQDADSLIIKTADLTAILNFLKKMFPQIKRITTYCRSHTAARKGVAELRQLQEAGLSRIHIGMESGSDEVLGLIRKGVKASDHIKAGLNVRHAGIELSEYVMPGLGGAKWSQVHARATAEVLNAVNPDFIRLRTFHAVPGTGMDQLINKGEFKTLSEDDILKEIRILIHNLDVRGTVLVSDHILNLFEDIEGKLPDDKAKIIAVIDRYFSFPEEKRLIYRLGRRIGAWRKLEDLADLETYSKLKAIIDGNAGNKSKLEEDISRIMDNYV